MSRASSDTPTGLEGKAEELDFPESSSEFSDTPYPNDELSSSGESEDFTWDDVPRQQERRFPSWDPVFSNEIYDSGSYTPTSSLSMSSELSLSGASFSNMSSGSSSINAAIVDSTQVNRDYSDDEVSISSGEYEDQDSEPVDNTVLVDTYGTTGIYRKDFRVAVTFLKKIIEKNKGSQNPATQKLIKFLEAKISNARKNPEGLGFDTIHGYPYALELPACINEIYNCLPSERDEILDNDALDKLKTAFQNSFSEDSQVQDTSGKAEVSDDDSDDEQEPLPVTAAPATFSQQKKNSQNDGLGHIEMQLAMMRHALSQLEAVVSQMDENYLFVDDQSMRFTAKDLELQLKVCLDEWAELKSAYNEAPNEEAMGKQFENFRNGVCAYTGTLFATASLSLSKEKNQQPKIKLGIFKSIKPTTNRLLGVELDNALSLFYGSLAETMDSLARATASALTSKPENAF